jgi:general secretion pathway protein D
VTSALVPAGTTTISSSSVQYLEVGLKLDVEPDIHPDGEVGIKLSMEDTSAGAAIDTGNGGRVYEVSTRNASTVLRLRDGETQVLAGLINDTSSYTSDKVPGLGDVPVVGALFGEHNNTRTRNEVVMSITPRLVGRTAVPDAANLEYWTGTEATLRNAPQVLRQVGSATMSAGGATGPAPAATAATPTGATRSVSRVPPSVLPRVPEAAPAAPAAGATGAPLSFTWQGANQAKVGQVISLTLSGVVPLEATRMSLRVAVDAALLKPLDATEGGVFRQGASDVTFTPIVESGAGQVGLEFQRPAAATGNAAASGSLATLRFEVLAASASTAVSIEQVSSSGAAGDVPATPPAPFNLTLTP